MTSRRLERFVALNVREALQLPAESKPKRKGKSLFADSESEEEDEAGGLLPTLPYGFGNRGAVAIIDVSRFGGGGGAKIRSIINPVFANIISVVHRFNGSVVKFVGDALICCWPTRPATMHTVIPGSTLSLADSTNQLSAFDEDSERAATLSAILCCFDILETFREYTVPIPIAEETTSSSTNLPPPGIPSGRRMSVASALINLSASGPSTPRASRRMSTASGLTPPGASGGGRPFPIRISSTQPFELKIHISIGCGSFTAMHVGRTGTRSEYFVAGPAAEDAMTNLQHTKPGEVALSEECWMRLQHALDAWEASDPISLNESLIEQYGRRLYIIRDDCEDLGSIGYSLAGADNTSDAGVNNEETFFPGDCVRLMDYVDGSLAKTLMDENSGDPEHGVHNGIRNVCIVFVRLPILSASGNVPELLAKAQKVMCIALDAVRQYEGSIRQFNFDDKGATALLVWGVEGYTHERGDEPFALHAALQIKEELLLTMGGHFGIGVSEGPVFSGVIGNSARSDGTVLGVAVNTAARLMCHSKAMGTVLCTETVKKQCEGTIEFKEGEHILIKGTSTPVMVYEPVQSRAAMEATVDMSSVKQTLAGREEEIKLIDEGLDGWENGKPTRLILSGTSGLGKTALCNYILSRLHGLEDLVVCEGRSNETHRLAPFHSLRVVLTWLFEHIHQHYVETGILEYRVLEVESSRESLSVNNSRHSFESTNTGLLSQQARQSLAQASLTVSGMEKFIAMTPGSHSAKSTLARKVADVLILLKESSRSMSVLNQVLDFQQQDRRDMSAAMPGASYIINISTIIGRILNKLSMYLRIKVCFVFEDVQWQDTAGYDVLCELIRRCPKILFCITSRPVEEYTNDHLSSCFKYILASERTTHIKLTSMDRRATAEMVKMHFNVDSIDTTLAKQLWKQSHGNPMIVELLCNDLVSRRQIEIQNRELKRSFALSQTQAGESMLPVDIRSAISAQVDRVPHAFKQILRVASVAGQYFSVTEICNVLKSVQTGPDDVPWSSPKQLLSYIREADKLNMLVLGVADAVMAAADSTPASSRSIDSPDMSARRRRSRRYTLTRPTSIERQDNISFRHYFLQQCIYSGLLPEHREHLHSVFADYYESSISTANKSHYLPILVHHLERIPDQGKRKLKWAEVAFLYYAEETRHVDLGLQAYSTLEKLMHEHPEDVEFDRLTLAKHHRLLAILHDQKWDAESALQECIFAFDLLDMPLPDPHSFRCYFDTLGGICLQHVMKTAPTPKRAKMAMFCYKQILHRTRRRNKWKMKSMCFCGRDEVTHLEETSHPLPQNSIPLDEDNALRQQISEALEIARITVHQLDNLKRGDLEFWKFLVIVESLNFSSALNTERPLQEALWMIIFGSLLLRLGWPKYAAWYVAKAIGEVEEYDKVHGNPINKPRGSALADHAMPLHSQPAETVMERMILRISKVIYFYSVGNWAMCEKLSQQLHEAFERAGHLCTPIACLNIAILSGVLVTQGKRVGYIEVLRLNHAIANEVDAAYYWGSQVACNIAVALAGMGMEAEADTWYALGKDQLRLSEEEGSQNYHQDILGVACLFKYELMQLHKARVDTDVQKWGEAALGSARELLEKMRHVPIMAVRILGAASRCQVSF
ncbi:Adenylate cyclase type 10 [Rhizophlyctis rosea]|nr:Adenylate cyclase type 10 [Rhizophlyctis rosea]